MIKISKLNNHDNHETSKDEKTINNLKELTKLISEYEKTYKTKYYSGLDDHLIDEKEDIIIDYFGFNAFLF